MDIVSPAVRSRRMAAVRRTDTRPELIVRAIVESLGHRLGSGTPKLPGSPDVIVLGRRKAIFVHGCFWHRHGCSRTTSPSSNRRFWAQKFVANVRRDRRVVRELRQLGWSIAIVWECQTRVRTRQSLVRRLARFLQTKPKSASGNGRRQGTEDSRLLAPTIASKASRSSRAAVPRRSR